MSERGGIGENMEVKSVDTAAQTAADSLSIQKLKSSHHVYSLLSYSWAAIHNADISSNVDTY